MLTLKLDLELMLFVISFPQERTIGFLRVDIIISKKGISIRDNSLKITKTAFTERGMLYSLKQEVLEYSMILTR